MIGLTFGNFFTDALSGYRVLSRRFVKSFPCVSEGFEIETELTVHALELRMKVAEVTATYRARAENSVSKLNTMRDGARILRAILLFVKEERPLTFFSVMSAILGVVSVSLAFPIFIEYFRSGLIPRSHGDSSYRTDPAGLPIIGMRSRPGHSDARSVGNEAASISRHSGPGADVIAGRKCRDTGERTALT